MNSDALEELKRKLAAVKPSLIQPKHTPKPKPIEPMPSMARIMQSWTVDDWRRAKHE